MFPRGNLSIDIPSRPAGSNNVSLIVMVAVFFPFRTGKRRCHSDGLLPIASTAGGNFLMREEEYSHFPHFLFSQSLVPGGMRGDHLRTAGVSSIPAKARGPSPWLPLRFSGRQDHAED